MDSPRFRCCCSAFAVEAGLASSWTQAWAQALSEGSLGKEQRVAIDGENPVGEVGTGRGLSAA
jgi:hypothetical protein